MTDYYKEKNAGKWDVHGRKTCRNCVSRQMWCKLRRAVVVGDNMSTFDGNVDIFNDFFLNNHLSIDVEPNIVDRLDITNFFSFSNITEAELLRWIGETKLMSVVADGFSVAYSYFSRYLFHMINNIQPFLTDWKIRKICQIPKMKESMEIENMRPISILFTIRLGVILISVVYCCPLISVSLLIKLNIQLWPNLALIINFPALHED